MNIPEIKSYEEQAIDTVVSVINRAKEKLGVRQTLRQLAITNLNAFTFTLIRRNFHEFKIVQTAASTRNSFVNSHRNSTNSRDFACNVKLSMKTVGPPFAITCEKFIMETIEKKWKLGETFMYMIKYLGGTKDEVSQYYYFEVIFSQPTISYPNPQELVFVFFRIEDKHIEPPNERGLPLMTFRLEGQYTDHDVRYVALTADWILAVLKMKMIIFKRIEDIKLF